LPGADFLEKKGRESPYCVELVEKLTRT
jgi:hypothetical protein